MKNQKENFNLKNAEDVQELINGLKALTIKALKIRMAHDWDFETCYSEFLKCFSEKSHLEEYVNTLFLQLLENKNGNTITFDATAKRQCFREIRRLVNQRHNFAVEQKTAAAAEYEESFSCAFETEDAEDFFELIENTKQNLPTVELRQTFYFKCKNYTNRQIAELMKCSASTVHGRLVKIRKILTENGFYDFLKSEIERKKENVIFL